MLGDITKYDLFGVGINIDIYMSIGINVPWSVCDTSS